jgi:hypothetical protein
MRPWLVALAAALNLRAAQEPELFHTVKDALAGEISSVADVVAKEKAVIANAEASKADAEAEVTAGDGTSELAQKIRDFDEEIAAAKTVIEEAEAMQATAESHTDALSETMAQKEKLAAKLEDQINQTGMDDNLHPALARATGDVLSQCLAKVRELDVRFEKMFASPAESPGTSFGIVLPMDQNAMQKPSGQLVAFGHFVPENAANQTKVANETVVPPERWPTEDIAALYQDHGCKAALTQLKRKYGIP